MIGDENLVYNMAGGIIVDEILDKENVKAAFDKIIERHSSLRTAFIVKENNVVQKIKENMQLEIPVYNNKEEEIQEVISNFSRPFRLNKEPLIKIEMLLTLKR